MNTKTLSAVSDAELLEFEAVVQGRIIRPQDAEYDDARALWNGLLDKYPALIVRCQSVTDVIAAVNFVREHALPVSVRGGGHNVAGSAVINDGVVIDLSEMKTVHVDVKARIARAGAGATLGDLDRATQAHGLVAPAGVVSDTGIAGLTLGGGLGWLRRKYGLTLDNLVAVQIVTADGCLRRASATENPDLFWGLRGGGGGLGVVTSFEYQLHPLGPDVMTAIVFYPGDDAANVMRQYAAYAATAPDEVSSFIVQGTVPEVDWMPAEAHGKSFCLVQACYAGDMTEGAHVMQPLREFGTPLVDLSGPMPFLELQTFWDEDYPSGELRYYWKSLYFNALDETVIEQLITLTDEMPSPLSTLDIWHLGGAISRVDPAATAYGNRNAGYLLGIEANWQDAVDDAANIAWARRVAAVLEPLGVGQYVNFPGFNEEREQMFGANYQRLQALQEHYDPTGVFSRS